MNFHIITQSRIIVCLCVLFLLPCLTHCGSNSAISTSTSTTSTFSLTGQVTMPSSVSTSVSYLTKAIPSLITEAAAPAALCYIYNNTNPPADGSYIAEVMTGSDGTYSAAVDISDVNAGDTLCVVCDDVGISGCFELPTDLGTGTASLGTANFTTTLVVEQLRDRLGSINWGSLDLDGAEADFNVVCFLRLAAEQWENAATQGDSYIEANMGLLEEQMAEALVNYHNGEAGTYASPADMYQDMFDNDSTYNIVTGVLEDYYAGTPGTDAPASLIKTVETTAADGSFCGEILADETYLDTAMDVLMQAGSIEEFTQTYANASAVEFLVETFAQYEGDDGYVDFDNAGYGWHTDAFAGMMQGLGGSYSGASPQIIITLMGSLPAADNANFDWDNYGRGYIATFMDYREEGGAPSAEELEQIAGYIAYQTEAGIIFDPTTDAYANYAWRDEFENAYDNGTNDFNTCVDDPALCYQTYSNTYVTDTFTQSTATTCVVDGTCAATEDVYICPADCAPTNTVVTAVCGDNYCDITTGERYTCPADCITSTCGNAVCDTSETTASCPVDCPLINTPGTISKPDLSGLYYWGSSVLAPCRDKLGGGVSVSLMSRNTENSAYNVLNAGTALGYITINSVDNSSVDTIYWCAFTGIGSVNNGYYCEMRGSGTYNLYPTVVIGIDECLNTAIKY
ncbi:MAG: hypothetical protein HQM16_01255 [Deltaproteobacteria bacterium]|nr:hypothetical protein [Deltaproteobacteria bacterium]